MTFPTRVFISLAYVGVFDMLVQIMTDGRVKPIQFVLGLVFTRVSSVCGF